MLGQMLGARHEHESERNTVPSPALSCLALGCKHSENKFRFPGNIYLGPCGERVRWPPCVLPAGWPGQEVRGLGKQEGQSVGP